MLSTLKQFIESSNA